MTTVRERMRERREEKKRKRAKFTEELASSLATADAKHRSKLRPALHETGGPDRSIPGNTTASQTSGWSTLLGLFRTHQRIAHDEGGIYRQVFRDGKVMYERVRPRRRTA